MKATPTRKLITLNLALNEEDIQGLKEIINFTMGFQHIKRPIEDALKKYEYTRQELPNLQHHGTRMVIELFNILNNLENEEIEETTDE